MTRIGNESIVTIPNFGFWTTRLKLLFLGKMPITGSLPKTWYETENIHLCTIKDFEILCKECGIDIKEKKFFSSSGKENLLTNTCQTSLPQVQFTKYPNENCCSNSE